MLIWAAVLAWLPPGARSQEASTVEYRIKAAYLFNFAKFVEWPSGASEPAAGPITIGVVGQDPFRGELERTIEGKSIDGRSLRIVRFTSDSDLRNCHILVVGASERGRISAILEAVKSSNVLTVGDELDSFTAAGGIINFTRMETARQETTIRFEINLDAAEGAALRISSKLLQVAKVVRHPASGRRD